MSGSIARKDKAISNPDSKDGVVRLQTKSVVDAVHEAVWSRIVSGMDPMGSLITEVGIASMFNVARPTAKAAVERLVADGLLVRDGRRGHRVPLLGPAEVRDLYESRLLIETHAHNLLTRRKVTPSEARTANEEIRAATAAQDSVRLIAADVRFHRTLVAAAGSERLARMHSSLMAEAHLCMGQVQSRRLLSGLTIANEHDTILQAIGAGKRRDATRHTKEHLENAERILLNDLFSSGDSDLAVGN